MLDDVRQLPNPNTAIMTKIIAPLPKPKFGSSYFILFKNYDLVSSGKSFLTVSI